MKQYSIAEQNLIRYSKKRAYNDLVFFENKLNIIEIHVNTEFINKSKEWRKNYIIYKYPDYIYHKENALKNIYRLNANFVLDFRIKCISDHILCKYLQIYIKSYLI